MGENCIVSLLLLISSGSAFSGSPSRDEIEQIIANRPADLLEEIVTDDAGVPISVIGRFQTNRGRSILADGDAAQTIEGLYSAFGFSRPFLKVTSARPIDERTDVVLLRQAFRGLTVVDMELSAVFDANGTLLSLNGTLLPEDGLSLRALSSPDQVLDRLRAEGLMLDVDRASDFIQPDPKEDVWENDLGFSLAFGWSIQLQSPVWVYEDDESRIYVSEALNVIEIDSRQENLTGSCNVRLKDFPRSSGYATILSEGSSSRTEEITCQADDWFGTCYWQLKREPSGYNHAIGRVLDSDGAEQEIVQSCSSSSVPQFTATNGDSLREQGAFYVANQMRFFTNQNAWSQVAPSSQANVQITVDDDGSSVASFSPTFTDIRCNQDHADGNGCAIDVLAHEYGHYVNWTYGGYGSTCSGSDHSFALSETLATIYGLLFFLDDDETLPQYTALAGSMLGNGPSPHTTSASSFSMDCTNSTTQRISGLPFTTAIWEVAWNRDCTTDSCTDTQTSNGTTIFSGLNREATITAVGDALSYANASLGQNPTFQQVRALMRSRIQSEINLSTATRFQRVMSHHGFTCSSCCTGC